MPAFLLPSQLQGAAPLRYRGSSQCLAVSPVGGLRGGKWGGVQSETAESEILGAVTPTVILAQGPEQAQKPGSHQPMCPLIFPDSWWPVRVIEVQCMALPTWCPPLPGELGIKTPSPDSRGASRTKCTACRVLARGREGTWAPNAGGKLTLALSLNIPWHCPSLGLE